MRAEDRNSAALRPSTTCLRRSAQDDKLRAPPLSGNKNGKIVQLNQTLPKIQRDAASGRVSEIERAAIWRLFGRSVVRWSSSQRSEATRVNVRELGTE